MALPHLLKYVYTHGTDEVVRRGKKIHTLGFVELVEYDDLFGSAVLRVKDDSYSTYYKVNIQRFKDPKDVSLRCSCPYNIGDICRHETAALFQLQEMIDRGQLQADGVKYDQRHTVAKMKLIEVKMLRMLSSPEVFEEAEKFLQTQKAKIELAENEMVKASVSLYGATYAVIIRKNEERNFDTSCDYDDTEHLLCLPKVIVFLQLVTKHGANYFDSIRNWDKDKNKLLEAYGYSLNDDLKGKFEFAYKDGKPFLRVLDANIKRVAPLAVPSRPVIIPQQKEKEIEAPVVIQEETAMPMQRLGIVFNFNKKSYPWFTIDAVIGEPNDKNDGFAGNAEKPDISRYLDTEKLPEDDRQNLTVVRKLQDAEINKYISRNSPFSGIWENIIHQEDDDLPAETKELMAEYLFPRLKKLCSEQGENSLFFLLPPGKPFKTSNLEPLQVIKQEAKPHFHVKKNGAETKVNYTIHCRVNANGIEYDLGQNESSSPLFFLYNQQLHLWKNNEVIHLIEEFLPTGKMEVKDVDWSKKLHDFLLPLAKEHQVDFDRSIVQEIKDGDPEVKLFLIEKGDYLVFQPSFSYKGYETKARDRDEIVVPQGEKVLIVHRNRVAENAFIAKLQGLHSNFIVSEETGSLALKGADVLKNNWFFLFVDAMKEIKTPVFGFEALKNFRFNTAKPQTKIFISSNTDWFDAKVDIIFGDQRVTVAEVKRALANKQQFVQLNDGTLGILPDEWLKKYSLLFRVGEGTNNNLKLSRFHLSVVDELYEERDEEELVVQLEEKYKNIRQFNTIEEIEPPANLKAILRPYQLAGYQWLNYLTEIKWGGILADDMGLGKTVQALSFLDHYRSEHDGHVKALVVCPTTLIYNWENEIKKFTPKLTYRIHHGPARTRAKEEITDHDVTITTYGTLRSDIKLLMSVNFDYVILDESQAIKNPSSKVTKAACLLNAKHRLCMSGTPLQNNTFDIFAQMHFLNPGMLGTMEFFRQEFAIPIDKFGEQDRKEHLKKILYPFILRRTKEQVAKDLPEKLEMILWCEMEDEQRKIYDAYRNEFRDKILGTIQEQGIQRSQLTILQGLMKLRQICDSPAILNEEEKFENHSIKLDELTREITENISNHKALVFSQFLGMLALIRAKLDELGVKYEYFDGSTTAPDREKAIQSFQNDDTVRVFLISLKAGGVGLNLTAADYVYIVDPWWNPAVEQQAIDRTHRIGQTKNIFAYRMICKDTIEDKILQLQDKKRALAKELIADDSSFVKSLSREDVEYLFS